MNADVRDALVGAASSRVLSGEAAVMLWTSPELSSAAVRAALVSNSAAQPALAAELKARRIAMTSPQLRSMVAHLDSAALLKLARSSTVDDVVAVVSSGRCDVDVPALFARHGSSPKFVLQVLSRVRVDREARELLCAPVTAVVQSSTSEFEMAGIVANNPWWAASRFDELAASARLAAELKSLRMLARHVALHSDPAGVFGDRVDRIAADSRRFSPAAVTAARSNPFRQAKVSKSELNRYFGGDVRTHVDMYENVAVRDLPRPVAGSWAEMLLLTRRASETLDAVCVGVLPVTVNSPNLRLAVESASSFDGFAELIPAVRSKVTATLLRWLATRSQTSETSLFAESWTSREQWLMASVLAGSWSLSAQELRDTVCDLQP